MLHNWATETPRGVTCSGCKARVPAEEVTISELTAWQIGTEYHTVAEYMCWFCMFPERESLPIAACLVPHISTDLQNKQNNGGGLNEEENK